MLVESGCKKLNMLHANHNLNMIEIIGSFKRDYYPLLAQKTASVITTLQLSSSKACAANA
jgi:hypothetical protein